MASAPEGVSEQGREGGGMRIVSRRLSGRGGSDHQLPHTSKPEARARGGGPFPCRGGRGVGQGDQTVLPGGRRGAVRGDAAPDELWLVSALLCFGQSPRRRPLV